MLSIPGKTYQRGVDNSAEFGNDEGLYHLAREAKDYRTFVDCLEACSFNDPATRDGVNFRDPKINVIEMDQMFDEM